MSWSSAPSTSRSGRVDASRRARRRWPPPPTGAGRRCSGGRRCAAGAIERAPTRAAACDQAPLVERLEHRDGGVGLRAAGRRARRWRPPAMARAIAAPWPRAGRGCGDRCGRCGARRRWRCAARTSDRPPGRRRRRARSRRRAGRCREPPRAACRPWRGPDRAPTPRRRSMPRCGAAPAIDAISAVGVRRAGRDGGRVLVFQPERVARSAGGAVEARRAHRAARRSTR